MNELYEICSMKHILSRFDLIKLLIIVTWFKVPVLPTLSVEIHAALLDLG